MRTPAKLIIAMILLLSVFSLSLVNGCGKVINGKASGRCLDNAAPNGFVITAQQSSMAAPFTDKPSCYSSVGFSVKDADGKPANDICVEIFSDQFIAVHSATSQNCNDASANGQSSLEVRTDSYGNVLLDFYTVATATGQTHFVQVTSGGATGATSVTDPAQ